MMVGFDQVENTIITKLSRMNCLTRFTCDRDQFKLTNIPKWTTKRNKKQQKNNTEYALTKSTTQKTKQKS